MTETQTSKEGNELDEEKEEHTQVELRGDDGVELVECFVTRCEQQDSLLKEQREKIRFLEAYRDEVSPFGPNEVERMSAVNGYTWSLAGMETPGFLELTRFPSVIVPESVLKCVPECKNGVSVMACVSACMEMDDRPIQTGDRCGEPSAPYKVILVTVPVPRYAAYEARLAFRDRPSRARLRGGIPVWERPAF